MNYEELKEAIKANESLGQPLGHKAMIKQIKKTIKEEQADLLKELKICCEMLKSSAPFSSLKAIKKATK